MKARLLAGAGLLALSFSAAATNGYFSHGIGMKSKGMGGAGIAYPQDAVAMGINPAGAGLVGKRVDVGLDWFRPDRGASISGNGFGLNGNYDGNGTQNYLIPEFGLAWPLNQQMTVGVALYGNGGLATEYSNSPFTAFGGSSPSGVDLSQAFLAPTFAWKPVPTQSIGVSLNLAMQRFAADGLQPFVPFSSNAAKVTNNGHDTSYGWGLKLGWIGKFAACTFGAMYQTKTYMSEFDDYAGLFADQGDFDIPSTWGVGAACPVQLATGRMTVAVDYQRINYSDVDAVHNPSALLFAGIPLGASGGPGFGWQDMNVFKLGLDWEVNQTWTVRAGWNYGKQPIRSQDAFINILAPGLVEHHFTLGATWRPQPNMDVTFGGMLAPQKKLSGPVPGPLGGGSTEIRLDEWSLGVAVGWRL
ncbi:MAG: outer membrane protein transport protein [Burkholderiales bacterium]|nr:outer membrane protein transport protein [Burkholderiales bacterium]